MAKAWASLADCIEKNEAVFALFGPEESEPPSFRSSDAG
jgi:hypothetical protein